MFIYGIMILYDVIISDGYNYTNKLNYLHTLCTNLSCRECLAAPEFMASHTVQSTL